MSSPQVRATSSQRPLRIWPGVVIVVVQWLFWFGLSSLWPEAGLYGVLGGVLGGFAVLLWWLFSSRAPWLERLGVTAILIMALMATPLILHVSVATAGQGMLFYIYSIPILSLALVMSAAVGNRFSGRTRRILIVATILLSCAAWGLLRTGGITGGTGSDFAWRWSPTPEERLLARTGDVPLKPMDTPLEKGAEAEWPGFRGPHRDSVIPAVQIATDWSVSPPVELWRRPIGPGWSSFAVGGGLLYTQEQRGENEIVSAYRLDTGEPVWRHPDPVRFWESNGGPGPRGTPTLVSSRIYAFGATGILNVLDAGTGAKVWSSDVGSDADVDVPGWGFSSSPLVTAERVFVAASGRLAAYDRSSGKLLWLGPRGGGYSSPQLATIEGVTQILLLNSTGITSFTPSDGTVLWQDAWPGGPIVQPALTSDGGVLIATGGLTGGIGMRRIAVTRKNGGWSVAEQWTSNRLKPYYNDFVVHEGHVYGFDGGILACIDVEDGSRKWKGGRFGFGQLLLLREQDLLLVISEQGELALVRATPDSFKELARFPALQGKTWNHPVLVDDTLLVRNGQEMAAFRLYLENN